MVGNHGHGRYVITVVGDLRARRAPETHQEPHRPQRARGGRVR